jgi:hypothetical protein
MQKPESVKCGNCMFGAFNNYSSSGGLVCHRFPKVRVGGTSLYMAHPEVDSKDWCGEFAPKDNLTAIEWVAWKKGLLEDGQPRA